MSAVSVRLAVCLTLLGVLTLAVPAGAEAYQYHRGGAWLDVKKRPSLLVGWSGPSNGGIRLRADGRGLEELVRGQWVYAIDDNMFEGLWQHGQWRKTGKRRYLRRAVRYASYLKKGQERGSGLYRLEHSYNITEGLGREMWLRPGWYGANAQGEAMSLLTRLYRATGKRDYLRQARRAMRPFSKRTSEGGVVSEFLDTGLPFYEGYASLPVRVHTIAHFLYAIIGLYDMSDLSPKANRLYRRGMRTLEAALPYYDGQDRAHLWLLHVTDPPRPLSSQTGYSQEALVEQMRALASVHPSPALHTYLDKWEHQLTALCVDPAQKCQFPHGS
jgi:hypothetical protein